MKYFTEIDPELRRKEFLNLCKIHHPDKGGNTAIFQEILNEYENLDISNKEKGFQYSKETESEFMEVIQKILHLNIEIEICGCWIWLSNTKKEEKEEYKTAGFYWAPKKKMWYFRQGKNRSFSRGVYSMDDIRGKYGSEKFGMKHKFVGGK